MSATMDVRYDEGTAAVSLADGTRVERGETVTVSEELGKQLVAQGWLQIKGGKPVDPPAPKPTDAAVEKADELDVDPSKVKGTGGPKHNQVTVSDVKDAAESDAPKEDK